jgi:hypothetical protein
VGELVIYTEDRDVFEATFFRPPFLARMLERTGRYIDGLAAKDAFLKAAHEAFWTMRSEITDADSVTGVWGQALSFAACSRARWLVHFGPAMERTRWVKGSQLGRHNS